MARDRGKNRDKVKEEKALDRRNAYGVADPTPQSAVRLMIQQEREDRRTAHSA